MTEAMSSLLFEKGDSESGNVFFVAVSGQFFDLSKSN